MAIVIDRTRELITLKTKSTAYQMKTEEHGILLHTYYGSVLTVTICHI